MQVFKRASTAYAAAGDQPILRIQNGSETLFIVGISQNTGVELISAPRKLGFAVTPSRHITGNVSLGHLDRLGNANGAYAAKPVKNPTFDLVGLLHRFHNDLDQEAHDEADKARRAAKKA